MSGFLSVGCCTDRTGLDAVPAAAFDYLEVTLSVLEEAAATPAAVARSLPRPPEVVMGMFPRGTVLPVARAERGPLLDRARRALDLMAGAGAELAVLGAGAARSIPPGVPREEGLSRLAELCREIGAEARERGLDFALENIAGGGSNVFNSLAEIDDFLGRFGLDEVVIAYDALQARRAGEPWEAIPAHARRLAHVHVPAPLAEVGPAGALDELCGALAAAGYRGRISIEPLDLATGAGCAAAAAALRRRMGAVEARGERGARAAESREEAARAVR